MDTALLERLGEQEHGDWHSFELPEGGWLWHQHDHGDGLAWLSSGTLEVIAEGVVIGQIEAGVLLGEAGGLLGGKHGVGLRAREVCAIARLDGRGVARLRQIGAPAYDRLLEEALVALAVRVRSADLTIAERARGELRAPARTKSKGSLWSRITGVSRGKPAPLVPALRRLPRLQRAPLDVLESIFQVAKPRFVPRDQALVLEGDSGRTVWIVASGRLEVLRHIGFQSARRLAWLNVGALMGASGLLTAQPRTASVVARAASWVYGIDPDGHAALDGEAGRVWRECLLAALASQIRGADRILADLERADQPASPALVPYRTLELPALLDAAGRMVAFAGEE